MVESLIDRLGGDKVYHTDKDSTIEFITDGARLWAQMENQEELARVQNHRTSTKSLLCIDNQIRTRLN